MAAPLPLPWKDDEGYDIHVLRAGPASKDLSDALIPPRPNLPAFLSFSGQFWGAPDAHFVKVDGRTGSVTARLHTDLTTPKLNNFLITAKFVDPFGPSGNQYTNEIRVHVHDDIDEIWLTPATLTIYHGSDECRFTVLARFTDKCVGDIADWDPALFTFHSSNPSAVTVGNDGKLQTVAAGGTSDITATVTLALDRSWTTKKAATVTTKKGWADLAKDANVLFVAGKQKPNADNARGKDIDSVQSVVDSAMNILFVSEGFGQSQRGDFNNAVWKVVDELRTKTYLLPYNLLKDSINFWSVFLPSQDEGVSPLGDFVIAGPKDVATYLQPGTFHQPSSASQKWTLPEMVHEVGLPIQDEAQPGWLLTQLQHWQSLYGSKVTDVHTQDQFGSWLKLAFRSVLNERDTAFGLAVADRPRLSKSKLTGITSLGCAPGSRRTSASSIAAFVANLTFGKPDDTGKPCNIGATWQAAGKDAGLVCFICRSDQMAGMATLQIFFAASTGESLQAVLLPVDAAKLGRDIKISAPERHSRTLLASFVSHECGHALGLADEYGDGEGTKADSVAAAGNVTDESEIISIVPTPSGGTRTVFDKAQNIKWLWPRVTKGGVLVKTPGKFGTGFFVTLRKGHSTIFKQDDVVQFREWPVKHAASADPFRTSALLGGGRAFKVWGMGMGADAVILNLLDAGGTVLNVWTTNAGTGSQILGDAILALFSPGQNYALVAPVQSQGKELKMVADPILNRIPSAGPLSLADPDADPGVCFPAPRPTSTFTPWNLPALSNLKDLIKPDIIGIYEGGDHHDCGVYRPAGRCKMRSASEKLMPFCHVCRYLIVDRIDPTKHGDLDPIYGAKYPQA